MKKLGLLLAAFTFAGCIGLTGIKSSSVIAHAEDEIVEPEDNKAVVVVEKSKHGSVEASVLEGVEGDVCELNVKAELLYLIKGVYVNGVALIEDENISGLYKFVLVKGTNTVSAAFVVNEELLGELSTIYAQARDKDWASLFTVENLLILLKWVLDCGVLIALIRYYVRDKRLAAKLEKSVKEEMDKILPETAKKIILSNFEEVLKPIFAQISTDNIEIKQALSVFSKSMALMQEGTPESRIAIIEMLSKLNISDEKVLAEVKAYIDGLFAQHMATYNSVMEKLEKIGTDAPAEVEPIEEPKPDVGDGTSI